MGKKDLYELYYQLKMLKDSNELYFLGLGIDYEKIPQKNRVLVRNNTLVEDILNFIDLVERGQINSANYLYLKIKDKI